MGIIQTTKSLWKSPMMIIKWSLNGKQAALWECGNDPDAYKYLYKETKYEGDSITMKIGFIVTILGYYGSLPCLLYFELWNLTSFFSVIIKYYKDQEDKVFDADVYYFTNHQHCSCWKVFLICESWAVVKEGAEFTDWLLDIDFV